MSDPKASHSPEPDKEEDERPRDSLSDLVLLGDAEAIMAKARAHRTGDGATRDMRRVLDCYLAAAELGVPEAQYSAALFYMSSTVVAQDLSRGATLLRSAADAGMTAATIYLANLYELGIHFGKSPERAEMWYRKAARSAAIGHSPGTPEFARALAELGAVRFALPLVEDPTTESHDQERILRKAKAMGFALALRPNDHSRSIPPSPDSSGALSPNSSRLSIDPTPSPGVDRVRLANEHYERRSAPDVAALAEAGSGPAAAEPPTSSRDAARATKSNEAASPSRASNAVVNEAAERPGAAGRISTAKRPAAVTKAAPKPPSERASAQAHLLAVVFLAAGFGGGALGREIATSHVAKGHMLPLVGVHAWAILPLSVLASLVLMILVYRPSSVLLGWALAVLSGLAAYVAHGHGGIVLSDSVWQANLAAGCVFLLTMLAVGKRWGRATDS